jgi:hypothetical protein
MSKLFNEKRIEEATTAIAAKLVSLLDRSNFATGLHRCVDGLGCYEAITNGELVVATLRALAIAQGEVVKDLTSLDFGNPDGPDEDEDGLLMVRTGPELAKRLRPDNYNSTED